MKRIGRFSLLRWISLGLVISAVLLFVFQLVVYSRLRSSFSIGTKIAGVDVSNLDQTEAAGRLTQIFSLPVELRYGESVIQVKPGQLGFSLDLTSMMTAADQARVSSPFWISFINYLFNKSPESLDIPLRAKVDEKRIRDYLTNEISSRYDEESSAYIPIPGSVTFQQGNPGRTLDVDRSVNLVTLALKSPSSRTVNLSLSTGSSSRPSLQTLQLLLQQIVDVNEFTGEVEIYMLDLQNGNELQMAYKAGEKLSPDIAFSADSTIKIAIMIEAFRKMDEPASAEITQLIQDMIAKSDNLATDELMRVTMSPTLGPVEVTKTIRALGLKNSFLDGMFYLGAPLLTGISTQANTRTDISTDPDIYNQTTPTEIGLLLGDIYQCAQNGGGSLTAVFPGEISPNECKSMITYLTQNRIGVLLEAGLPEGTAIGHKHGWAVDPLDGVMHTVGDAGLVYSPGGNYVITIFAHNNEQIVWESANRLFADLSNAVYNYFNLQSQ